MIEFGFLYNIDPEHFICSIPPNSLACGVRYDKMAAAFGAEGYGVETVAQLHTTLHQVFTKQRQHPVIINVAIDPSSARKPQVECSGICAHTARCASGNSCTLWEC